MFLHATIGHWVYFFEIQLLITKMIFNTNFEEQKLNLFDGFHFLNFIYFCYLDYFVHSYMGLVAKRIRARGKNLSQTKHGRDNDRFFVLARDGMTKVLRIIDNE
jgi:hypothetical protein